MTLKLILLALVVLVLALLSACGGMSQSTVGANDFDPNKLGYFRDARTNACFAVAIYSRTDTSGHTASGLSHSYVPCTPEVEKLVQR